MKTKLLRKVRKDVKLVQRNNKYYVMLPHYTAEHDTLQAALRYYRIWIIRIAKDIFGFKYKKSIK